ncbi:MAG: hypothetical protein Q4F95_06610 [Oscillospiraceae bacterium]|nr:hypothetical protein [Oscillospiraceae bacterium]
MNTDKKVSLLEYIKQNMKDGILPSEFSLPEEVKQNTASFADGALDGISLFHMGHTDVTEEDMKILDKVLHAVSEGNFEDGSQLLTGFSEKNSALKSIDQFERFIMNNTQWINAQNLYTFAVDCLNSDDKETVKFGLEIIEVFSEPSDNIKEIIRILALSDEFTIFAVFNMMGWKDSNAEIFSAAKKVHGWGRIHAVERLEPSDSEIKDWLLSDAIFNDVYPSYSAHTVAGKINIQALAKENLSDSQLESVSQIIFYLMDEGPVTGISGVDNADEMLSDFLTQVKNAGGGIKVYETVFHILSDKEYESLHGVCDEIIKSEKCKACITDEVSRGKGVEIAKYLSIDFKKSLFEYMSDDFDNGYYNCSQLIGFDEYRDKVLDLFRKNLPMDEMAKGPADIMGTGREYRDYSKLAFIIQSLCAYPMCGEDFVRLGLKSPVINNRNISLRALDSWCKAKKCTLEELSEQMYADVQELREKEVSSSVLENLRKYTF